MTIQEFLRQLDTDPFDPEIIALFDSEAAHHAAEANSSPDPLAERLKLMKETTARNDARCRAYADAQRRA